MLLQFVVNVSSSFFINLIVGLFVNYLNTDGKRTVLKFTLSQLELGCHIQGMRYIQYLIISGMRGWYIWVQKKS